MTENHYPNSFHLNDYFNWIESRDLPRTDCPPTNPDVFLLEDFFRIISKVVILSKKQHGFFMTLETSWVGPAFPLTLGPSTHLVLLKSVEALL